MLSDVVNSCIPFVLCALRAESRTGGSCGESSPLPSVMPLPIVPFLAPTSCPISIQLMKKLVSSVATHQICNI